MLRLSGEQLNLIFPFCFKTNTAGKVSFIGSSLKALLGDNSLHVENLVVQVNGVSRPLLSLVEEESVAVTFAIQLSDDEFQFTGLLVRDHELSELVFLGGPVLTDTEKIKLLKSRQITFGKIDSTRELLEEIDRHHFLRKEMTEVAERLMSYHDELIDTTARLNSLLDSLDSAILSESYDRKIVVVNELFCKLFQMPGKPSDYVGMDCSQAAELSKEMFVNPEDFVVRINDLVAAQKRVTGELLHLKDGRVLQRDFIPVFEQGIYAGHTWKYEDITEALHNKENLIKTEDKYSRIIENLKFGLVEVDLNEIITKVYPAFCELTGYAESELIGQNARELLSLKEDMEDSEELNEKRKGGVSNVYERRIRRKDGQIIYLIISGAPIFNDNNEIIGSMGIHVDITDRKLLEQDLTNAKEAALASMKAKEMFLANMSHEIRTPMNVIIGMTDLIADSELNSDQRKYVNAVKTSADNLLDLINDILDFSKIEAGHLQLEEKSTDLFDLFTQLELGFTELASKKGISFSCDVDQRISPSVITDSSKLNQVLVNLISNAIKFTEQGHVNVQAVFQGQQEQQQRILFKVTDSGIGIEKTNLEHIFSTFIQEDAGTSRKFGGTGLGLSISRSIIRKMGGDILVDSKKGVGSTFYFELTFVKGATTSGQDRNVSKPSEVGGLRILVAEDNELNRLLISSVLNKEKLQHRIAVNGIQAIEFLKQDRYDIILMDIQMPEMDGITATRVIREELKLSIPIVALSANATADDTRKYLSVGMNAHVPKPFKKEQLFDVINGVLNLSSPNTPIESETPVAKALFSTEELENIGGGDAQFVHSVLETFVATIPEQLESLETAMQLKNVTASRSIAHQVKPSIDLLHIHVAKDLVRTIEKESADSEPDFAKLQLSVDAFNRVMRSVVTEIQRQLG